MEIYYRIVIGTVFLKLTLSPKRTDLTKHLFGVWNKVWKKRDSRNFWEKSVREKEFRIFLQIYEYLSYFRNFP